MTARVQKTSERMPRTFSGVGATPCLPEKPFSAKSPHPRPSSLSLLHYLLRKSCLGRSPSCHSEEPLRSLCHSEPLASLCHPERSKGSAFEASSRGVRSGQAPRRRI